MGSAEIARGFILAYRIAKKAIECGGENTFLQKQELFDTPYDVGKKTGL
jgi:hypothetical protein